MGTLAIIGDKLYGGQVIDTLKDLGGKECELTGKYPTNIYYIDPTTKCIAMDAAFVFNEDDRARLKLFKILTLNEFKKLFPFTKFDMVYLKEHTNKLSKAPVYQITSMRWDHHMDEVEYELREWDNGYKGIYKYRTADELTKDIPNDILGINREETELSINTEELDDNWKPENFYLKISDSEPQLHLEIINNEEFQINFDPTTHHIEIYNGLIKIIKNK